MHTSRRVHHQGWLVVLTSAMLADIGWVHPQPSSATPEARSLLQQLETLQGDLSVARLQLDRAEAIMEYSGRYEIPATLAAAIYDIALVEGIQPGLAFRLVNVESHFNLHATSQAGALGLTQILPSTARLYDAALVPVRLYDRDTNLRLGFRYLRELLDRYDGDLERALLAYNRGPSKVEGLLSAGRNPGNGYPQSVLEGYRRTASTSQ